MSSKRWKICDEQCVGGLRIVPAEGGRGVAVVIQRDPDALGQGGISAEEALINARLIAAAPELLAELEMLSSVVEGCGMAAMPEVECRLVFARAAIARATGDA
ncbi:hypothetical protein BCL79_0654 [Stenotrophomonas rhizophila]|uniref:Uncharacterized protein n=1 Tax=Stenotrophomonas rhizophila TaxID=216778 RepID=A0A498CIN9_9GAMM|nr:hypothetical protein [Stenotrophomonas rhizophila]RLK56270.1 hypothetical protein BCL79_0654 [Stenotrophomonas rhizophila]